ncbi:DUF1353 domain-containing protein [Amphritea atlantica]|uniref:DUF1353 domain-containing protein n=1 Tax=Amphritea atlantica TaxID=355243 RepID=A0ABY5GXA5_9GAMM|nr:DUF1353 domain-containing protein [Amphritea atlantica]
MRNHLRSIKFIRSLTLLMLLTSGNATGAEFGSCDGAIRAEWLEDGRNMRLLVDYVYTDAYSKAWLAPEGSVVDGASIPQVLWSFIGSPFVGLYRKASVTHDVECENETQEWRAVHKMFYAAMRCSGVSVPRAKIMYAAVYQCGPRWGSDLGVRLFPCREGVMRSFVRRWKSLIYDEPDIEISELEALDSSSLVARADDPVEVLVEALGGLATINESDDAIRVSIPVGTSVVADGHVTKVADKVSATLGNIPGISITVEGHADSTGSSEMNFVLSQRRADATAKRLMARGIEPSAISTTGYGETSPVAAGNTAEDRARNRRIDIVIREEL